MKINMYKLLSNIDNKNVLEDCVGMYDYIHILNNTIYGCKVSSDWLGISFYNRLPEFIEKMIDGPYNYFIYNYIRTDLFKYLSTELDYYFDKLVELENIKNGLFIQISGNIIDLKDKIRSVAFHFDSTYYNTVKSYSIKEIFIDIYHAFDIILKCCDNRVVVRDKYSEFLTKLKEVCVEILSNIEFSENEES